MAVSLLDSRSRIAQELTDNPDVRRKLIASIQAEVGDQSSAAQLAYAESVMNRAAARGITLDATISDPGYYPKSTLSKLGNQYSGGEAEGLHALVDQALAGSNISNFATGNESGKVRSGGAPVAFNPGTGERFVVENADRDWAIGSGANLPVAGSGVTSVPSTDVTTPVSESLADIIKKRKGLMN
ncbi:MAG TPA: hypothetical protein VFO40_05100 [Chthoniobacterales bacterium]|nr:hypothetical protein [Chthoniobacterales bacterium]